MIPSMLNIFLPVMLTNNHKVLLVGDPGIGKTTIIRTVAKMLGYRLIEIHLSSYTPGDVRGFLMVVDGVPQFVPIGSIASVLSSDIPTIVLLDDLGHADLSVMKPGMQLVRGRLGDFIVPDHVRFIAATNDKKDQAGVRGIIEPFKSSFWTIIQAEVSTDDCNQFAVDHDWRSDIRSFLAFHSEYWHKPNPTTDIVNSPSPRQNDHLNDCLNDVDQMVFPKATMRNKVRREVIVGACGKEYAEAWIQHELVLAKCPKPTDILENPKGTMLPDFHHEQSALFATVCAVANLFTNDCFHEPHFVDSLWAFADRLPAPFQRHLQHEMEGKYADSLHHSWCVQHEIDSVGRDWTF